MRVSVRRVPFEGVGRFSSLFRNYCTNYEALADFFAGDYRRPDVRVEAVGRTVAFGRDRETLADVLLRQNARWGLTDPVRTHVEALRDPDSAAVVAGQQVGLFTGPIYTMLKALSTVQMAQRLSTEAGRHVVPVFWLGGEDHDFEEVSTTVLLHRNEPVALGWPGEMGESGWRGEPVALGESGESGELGTRGRSGESDQPDASYRASGTRSAGPVGRIRFDARIERTIARLDEVLPPTEFKRDVLAAVRASYQPGTTFSDAFARLLRRLFDDKGLVIIDSDDPSLKQLVAPLYRREIMEPGAVASRVRRVSDRLAERYHVQAQVRPVNLFLLHEGGRFPLDPDGDGFVLGGHGRHLTRAEVLDLLDCSPERFSPNVVLRPLTQDVLLPTAAYVGGPGEIAYLAQCGEVYEWAGVPMPLVVPRAGVTLLEPAVTKVLDVHELTIADLDQDLGRLFHRVARKMMAVDVDALFREAHRHLRAAIGEVKPPLREIDGTLAKAAEATRQGLHDTFDKLRTKAIRLDKKKRSGVYARLGKAQAHLYPTGTLQERVLSPLHFLNKHGFGLVDVLFDAIDVDTTSHQVVRL